ncbi:MAG: patatin-like phospholipase family protein [Acidimicrobiales bacterium]
MSRALVLGGGGPVGIAWEAGLVVGFRAAGVELGEADLVVGTSAGSVVGAHLTAGSDLEALVRFGMPGPALAAGGGMEQALERFMLAAAEALAHPGTPEQARAQLGRFAVEAAPMPEEAFLAAFVELEGLGWPKRFACTAVDVASGEFVVWDRSTGADLVRAVASSCAVPGIFPPITIGGKTYMDGGMRTALNADVVAGQEQVLVISVMALLGPEVVSDPLLARLNAERDREFSTLAAAGSRVEVIEPDAEFLELSGWGMHLMDFGRADAAFDAGQRLAQAQTARVAGFWDGA